MLLTLVRAFDNLTQTRFYQGEIDSCLNGGSFPNPKLFSINLNYLKETYVHLPFVLPGRHPAL